MSRGVFVTGTDTGVGKTLVACEIVRILREADLEPGVMKPVETGVGDAGPLDALALAEAAGYPGPIADVCPLQLALPAAPSVAARAEGVSISIPKLDDAYRRIASRSRVMVVEGAGGLLVPLTDRVTMADLAARLGLPLLLVARAALGTINHTLMTLEVAEGRGLEIAGVVISHADGTLSDADESNLDCLRRALGSRLIGEVPPLPPGGTVPPSALDASSLLRIVSSRQ